MREDSLGIFLKFEKYFPRFKKWKYDSDKATGHKEKNYYSHVILDCQEWVLKCFFKNILDELWDKGICLEEHSISENQIGEILEALDRMGEYDVDSVGSVIKRSAVSNMSDYDFSLGRVDVREYQRKLAIEAGSTEKITSVDSSETLKEKTKQESFH